MWDDILILALGGLLLCGTPELAEALDPPIYYRPPKRQTAADLPVSLRHRNYAGGSCMWSSAATCLQQGGRSDMAEWLVRSHSGAAGIEDIERAFKRSKTKYKSTVRGDVSVLDFAHRTRRFVAIYYKRAHAVTFCGWSRRNGSVFACLIDNNNTGRREFVSRDVFLRAWRGYGGAGIVPLYSPIPSKPYDPRLYEVNK